MEEIEELRKQFKALDINTQPQPKLVVKEEETKGFEEETNEQRKMR